MACTVTWHPICFYSLPTQRKENVQENWAIHVLNTGSAEPQSYVGKHNMPTHYLFTRIGDTRTECTELCCALHEIYYIVNKTILMLIIFVYFMLCHHRETSV